MQSYSINQIVPDYQMLIKWSRREIRSFWTGVLKQIDFRISQLQDLIHQNPAYSNLILDYNPLSLIPIGKWLKENVTTKPIPKEKYESELKRLNGMEIPPNYELSDFTKSICFDIAIYYGETMLRQLGNNKWFIYNKVSTNNLDFGTMGIRYGKHNVIFSPFILILSKAFQITLNNFEDKEIYTVFHRQVNTIKESESKIYIK